VSERRGTPFSFERRRERKMRRERREEEAGGEWMRRCGVGIPPIQTWS
jgi:hypothetical protein